MFLTLVISGKNVPYIGGQWEECSLHWWSVGRMSLTLVISGKNATYFGDQWEEYPLHWWSVGRMLLTLVVSGKNVPYIGVHPLNLLKRPFGVMLLALPNEINN
ncbi:unnamed protein product [Staurois parvus]|uniref:Uncharacterized protein n=1 Tax=Staurois parvus TaxID=386267 RepID=A0ABN9EQP9_9NEOB|nr:unnamed protein product [Staurois parvus]